MGKKNLFAILAIIIIFLILTLLPKNKKGESREVVTEKPKISFPSPASESTNIPIATGSVLPKDLIQ